MSEDKAGIWLYYWRILASDIPEPVPEYRFDSDIGRKHRFDYAYLEEKVAVEIDGGQWSARGGRHAGDKDREKLNIAASRGWRVFRFSPDQLKSKPEECIQLVQDALK